MELTQKTVEAALYEGRSHMSKAGRKRWSQHILWDDRLPGLGLRITSTNRKSFIVSYRAGGRKRTKTLGKADKLELDEARRRAAEFLDTVTEQQPRAMTGAAPLEGVETVAQLADAYLEGHLKTSTPSWFAEQRLMRTHIKPAMGRSLIADVSQTDLANLRSRVARRFPADARRLRSLLTGMFDWAAERGLWSRSRRRTRPAEAVAQAVPGPEPDGRPEPEHDPEPLPSTEQLMESLRRSEDQRQELTARLEEVSSSGVEMLAKLNEQATAHSELEARLAVGRRELQAARAKAKDRLDPEKVEKQTANLRQSVEQLMESLEQAESERAEMADKLAVAEARAGEQARNLAGLTRSRNELEDRMREEQRKAAIRTVPRRGGGGRRLIAGWLAAGAVAGVLLTLLLQSLLGRPDAPVTPAAAAESVAADGAGAESSAADPGGGLSPGGVESASIVAAAPTAPTEPSGGAGEPDFAAAKAVVLYWAAAWSEQRVDDYLATYSAQFVPSGGQGRGEWASQRRNRILRPASIQVTLGALSQTAAGADRVRVSFEQSYETPTYADRVLKTLELVWEDGSWKIAAELAG